MADITYIVKKGDTLSEIAVEYNTTVAKLVQLNNIADPDFIVIGQKLIISGSQVTTKKTTTSQATVDVFGLQSNTDRTMYATWTWTKNHTKEYQTIWYYATGDGVWFIGNESTTNNKQSLYTAPSNATKVKFKVKPVSDTIKSGNKESVYWTANWSTEKTYNFSDNPPTKPSAPTVTIEKYKLTAELDNLNVNGTSIQFQIVKNNSSIFKTGTAAIKTNTASYSCNVEAGHEYKVRCRSYRDDMYSEWSEYSDNKGTIPTAPSQITTCKAKSETSIYLEWQKVNTATDYDIEYTTKKEYFDGSNQTTIISTEGFNHYEITGLESGETYFLRIRAVNDNGESAWSNITFIVIGKDPAAPTTWSSTTTSVVGEDLTLYWVHNTEDGSSQTYAELELIINGDKETYTIKNTEDEEEKDKTSYYAINTTEYSEGTKILWRVRTAGVTKVYGDWSVQRTIDVYAPPTLEFNITNSSGLEIDTLTSFPIIVKGLAGPNTQKPIGYHLTIAANKTYETTDYVGNVKMVSAGEVIYSKYFDTDSSLSTKLSAGDVNLENNIKYTIACTVAMNSGLTVTESSTFTVAWNDEIYEPNAEIEINKDTLTASIRAYCEDENGNLINDVTLSIYRRESNGRFIEIANGLRNVNKTFVTDPHPALDYARYRIVAISDTTGSVSYCDLPGYPVDSKEIVIQWDEAWSSYNYINVDMQEEPSYSGSMLKLPYNIDVSDKNSPDVQLITYAGREHPVSYYGTHLGITSTWSVEIAKSDKETLYALRRLSAWMGDVYVREPSGSGYWANVTVSFNQQHCKVTTPVTIDITRVEGGV